jgi:hypothetical protein
MNCLIENCNKKNYGKGLCRFHWKKQWKNSRTCSIENCNKPHEAKGLCRNHYRQSFCEEQDKKDKKKYYKKHKDILLHKSKERYEKIKKTTGYKEYSKQYYIENKEKIKNNKKEKYWLFP